MATKPKGGSSSGSGTTILFTYQIDKENFPEKPPANVSTTQIDICDSTRKRLNKGQKPHGLMYLNDDLLHMQIARSMKNHELVGEQHAIVVYSSNFYTKLTEKKDDNNYLDSYGRVINWCKRQDPFSTILSLLPIHEGLHWSLACIVGLPRLLCNTRDTESSTVKIFHLDPLGAYHDMEVIGRYIKNFLLSVWLDLRNEARRNQHNEFAMRIAIMNIEVVRLHVASQINNYECGIYVCLYSNILMEAYGTAAKAGQ